MRILVTGATGLVGKHLCRLLLGRGHEIYLLTRSQAGLAERFPFPAKAFIWKGRGELPAEAFAGVEAVVHLAGEGVASKRWSAEQKKEIKRSRVEGTEALLAAIRQHGAQVRVVVGASAIGIYGDDRGDEVLTEASPAGKGFLAEVTKAWELAFHQAALPPAIRRAQLRIGIVLGKGGGALEKLGRVAKLGLAGRLGSGQQWMSWIHIDDVCEQILFLIENDRATGNFLGVGPDPVTNQDFTRALTRVLKVWQAPPVPAFALKLVVGEMAGALLGSLRAQPARLQELGYRFRFTNLHQALAQLYADEAGCQEFLAEQWIPRSPQEVFPFFASEKNLEQLTPPFLGFQVLGKSTSGMQTGTLIDYRLKIHGLPIRWRTRIEDWQPNREFVDNQLKGPYSRWHHTHRFEAFAGGTLMQDRVLYRLPFGLLGQILAGAWVAKDVATIFRFREATIRKIMGGLGG